MRFNQHTPLALTEHESGVRKILKHYKGRDSWPAVVCETLGDGATQSTLGFHFDQIPRTPGDIVRGDRCTYTVLAVIDPKDF